jgi:lycopene beta-cyclase
MGSDYDLVLVGGGLAGLSLAFAIAGSPLGDRRLLLIEAQAKPRNDRYLCFWTDRLWPFDGIVGRSWSRARFVTPERAIERDLGAYRYLLLRGIDLNNLARAAMVDHPGMGLDIGRVERIEETDTGARVHVGDRVIEAGWVFDSRPPFEPGPPAVTPSAADRPLVRGRPYVRLWQQFVGWIVRSARPAFDAEVATLFDFRTQAQGEARFFYVLPFSERHALVEFTVISGRPLAPGEAEAALRPYLQSTLAIGTYEAAETEAGAIPMTDAPFVRRASPHVLNIGTRGGLVKPSTGYAFRRIQDDSAAIVRSLLAEGHPFDLPRPSAAYRRFDSAMLSIMAEHGDHVGPVFAALFANNPVERVFRFLDEAAGPGEAVRLMASLPRAPMLRAVLGR